MKKVFEIYDKVAEWLCSFDSDKYVHLLFGLLISFAVSWAFMLTTMGATKPVCAVCGLIAAVFVGFIKEVVVRRKGLAVHRHWWSDWSIDVFDLITCRLRLSVADGLKD